MKVAVTGAGGYIGSRLVPALQGAGHDVVALGRRPAPGSATEWRHYDLHVPPDRDLMAGVDWVVHCAWDMQVSARAAVTQINVGAVKRLVRAAQASGTHVCFISSMSAYTGTEQVYGQAKLRCEEAVEGAGGRSVRPGLVYGETPGGMFGALQRLARLPVVPLIGARSHQFLVHEDDLVAGIAAVLSQPPVPQPLGLAHPVPVGFEDLVRDMAARQGRALRPVAVPWRPVYGSMRAVETARVRLPIRADSVLGLVRPAPDVPNHEYWKRVGVPLRPYRLSAAPARARGERGRLQ